MRMSDTRPQRINFIESFTYILEIYRAQNGPPEWVPILDDLIKLKRFYYYKVAYSMVDIF